MTKEETCKKCGRKLVMFVHSCPVIYRDFDRFGCPECDDHCAACRNAKKPRRKKKPEQSLDQDLLA
jgi:hypothetical protein